MPKKELLKWEKVALTYGADNPAQSCFLESEEGPQIRRRFTDNSAGMGSNEAQYPPAFTMEAVAEDGHRSSEQNLRDQAAAEPMLGDLARSAKYERDLLEKLHFGVNTAGTPAETDRESSRNPEILPSGQRHTSGSFEQQLLELSSIQQGPKTSNSPADKNSGQFNADNADGLVYQEASRDRTEKSQITERSDTPIASAYPDKRAFIAQNPELTVPYNNSFDRLFGHNHHEGRTGPALQDCEQRPPSFDPQDYRDGRFSHNECSFLEDTQSQKQFTQRQGQPQSFSTSTLQQELSSTQHCQVRLDQGPILQPPHKEESRLRPQPPYLPQPVPQRSQFGFEQSYTGESRQVFKPLNTTFIPQTQFQSSQHHHGEDRSASRSQYTADRNQTQRQSSPECLFPDQSRENREQFHAQSRQCDILDGYNNFRYPERENLLKNLEFPRPKFVQNNLPPNLLSDRFCRQEDDNRYLGSLCHQSFIEKRERVDKDTTFWKALFSLSRKNPNPSASSDGPQYQSDPESLRNRFASHPFVGIYPKGPVSTAHLEKVLNDQEELLQNRKRASQSSVGKSIPQKRIGTTQRLLNRLNFRNRKASSNRAKLEEVKLQSGAFTNLRAPSPSIFQDAQADLLESKILDDRDGNIFEVTEEVPQTSLGHYRPLQVSASSQTPNPGTDRQFLTDRIYDTVDEGSYLSEESQQLRSRTLYAEKEHRYSHSCPERHPFRVAYRGRRRSRTLDELFLETNRAGSFLDRRVSGEDFRYESISSDQEISIKGQQFQGLVVPKTRRRENSCSQESNHLPEALTFDGHEDRSPLISPRLPSDPPEIGDRRLNSTKNHPRSQYLFGFNQDLEEAKRGEVEALEHILDLVRIREPEPEEIDRHIQHAIEEAQIVSTQSGKVVRSEFEVPKGQKSNPELQQAIRDEAARQIKGGAAIAAFHNEIDQIPDPKKNRDEAKLQGLELFENNTALLFKRGYSLRKHKLSIADPIPPGPIPQSITQLRLIELNRAEQQRGKCSRDHRRADCYRSHRSQSRIGGQTVRQLYQISQSDIVEGRSRLSPLQPGGASASRSRIGQLRPVQSKKKDPTVLGAFGVALKPAVSREGQSVDSPFKFEPSSANQKKPTTVASINRRLSNGSDSTTHLFSDSSNGQYKHKHKIKPNEKAARRREEKEDKSAKRTPRQRTVLKETGLDRGSSEVIDNEERVLSNKIQRGISRGLLPHNSLSLKKKPTSVAELAQRFRLEEENSDQLKRGQQAATRTVRKLSGAEPSQSSETHRRISKDTEIPPESQVIPKLQRPTPVNIQNKDQDQASGRVASAVPGGLLGTESFDPTSGRSSSTPPTSGSRIPRPRPPLVTSRPILTTSRPALTSSAAAPFINQQVHQRSATGPSTQQQRHRGSDIGSNISPRNLRIRPSTSSSRSATGPASRLRSFDLCIPEARSDKLAKSPFLGSRHP